MLEAQASGWATLTLFYTTCLTLCSRTPPTELGVRSWHLSSVRDPGLVALAAAGWRCLRAGVGGGGAGAAEAGQRGGRGPEKRASCWRPVLNSAGVRRLGCKGILAGNAAVKSPGMVLYSVEERGRGEKRWCEYENSSGRPGGSSISQQSLQPGGSPSCLGQP
jgi:hypothetical protein